jgi:hypothetical protein
VTIKRAKKQFIEWEKYLQIIHPANGLYPEYIRGSKNSINQNTK